MFTSGDFDPENDYNFDTVFEGKTTYDKNAWYVEMRIPYSALRFPKKDIQEWGINFGRVIPEKSEYYIWNSVDPKLYKYQQGFGLLKGIKRYRPARLDYSFILICKFLKIMPREYHHRIHILLEWT